MTKKHFVAFAFAAELKSRFSLTTQEQLLTRPTVCQMAFADVFNSICSVAHQFNPHFDEARFLAACFN